MWIGGYGCLLFVVCFCLGCCVFVWLFIVFNSVGVVVYLFAFSGCLALCGCVLMCVLGYGCLCGLLDWRFACYGVVYIVGV